MNKYLKFEYWNTCDLGNIYYQGGQHFIFYLDADVGEPIHEEVEEGQENGDGDFIATYRRQMKRYRIRTGLIPDYLIDAIQRMKLHDHIELTFKSGEVEQIYNVDCEAEWQFEKYAWQGTVTLTFDMDESITVGACCDNLVVQNNLCWVAETGSDISGDGTIDKPWLTIQHGVDNTPVGWTLFVKAGTYNVATQITIPVGVSIRGEGDTSIIKSSVGGTGYPNNTLLLSSASEGTDGNQSISYIKMDGNSRTAFGAIFVRMRSNVEIHHCTIVDFDNNGVIFNGASGTGSPTTKATGNKFYNNHVQNCSAYSTEFRWLLAFNGQDGFEAYNNTMIQEGRGVGLNGCVIKCVGGYDINCKIYDNYLEADVASADRWSFAIELWNQENIRIYGNTIKGIVDIAGYTSKNTYLYNNVIGWDDVTIIESSGVIIECNTLHDGVFIYKNIIRNVNRGIIFYPTVNNETYQNIRIYYNLIYNIGRDLDGWTNTYGISGYTGGRTGWTLDGLKIYNNVIIALTRAASSQTAGIALFNEVGATFQNVEIINNIIMGWEYACIMDLSTAIMDYVTIKNNISYGNAFNNDTRFDVVPTNYDATAHIKSDPLFVSSTDFKLQTGSQCINAGIDVGLTTDYDGQAVSDPPEIGAYEYQE